MRIFSLVVALGLVAACGDNYLTTTEPASVTVGAISGMTTEQGGQATFTVVLDQQPTSDVTFALSSTDDTEGTVRPGSLRFTAQNWNAPQTVTVFGVDDPFADGNVSYMIRTAAGESDDMRFAALDPSDVSVVNMDNDTAGVTVSPTTGLVTSEGGTTASFAVFLQAAPTADVRIDVSSSDSTEGTADRASLTFTQANFNAPQLVTINGVDDPIADGAQAYTINLAAAVSTDMAYSGMKPSDVHVTNVDNETAGITLSRTTGLVTGENGMQDTFTVVLNTQPTANVTIGLTSSDTTEGTVSPASVTFTTANWNAPQTVTLTGVDDPVADGDQVYTIVTAPATSTDSGYSGMDSPDVSARNIDNDSPGVMVTPTAGLVTTEAGGQATFTVVLASQPTADVTITLTSNDTTEGTVSPASLTFSMASWNAPQTVTLTGVDDAIADGSQPYTIITSQASSADARYSAMNVADVSATNTDNDSAGFVLSRTSGLVTSESGGQDTFTIALASQPVTSVTIGLTSSRLGEATVGPASVTFTPANWNAPQTVTATGVDDFAADGNQMFTIVTANASGDAAYAGLNPPDVTGTNTDNDSPGVIVTPTSGLVTTEAGGQATFTIVLASQPTGAVQIPLMSSDTTEGTITLTSVTFTPANWNAPQPVTVTGVNDTQPDGNQAYQIITGAIVSVDAGYAGVDPPNVSLTNIDDDLAGISVSPTSGLVTSEAGGNATFLVVLLTQPSADVVIGLSSSDATEGVATPFNLTFSAANWNVPQLVTVTGVDDALVDGAQPYTIRTLAAVSADPNYNGLDPADVSVINTDDDSPGIVVSPTSGLVTDENLATDTFTIRLLSQPTSDVTINLTSSDTTEGTVSPPSITFTAVTWSSPQTVTVTGVNDAIADGNQPYTIVTSAASSGDVGYNGVDPADVSVINNDNDTPGITVTPTGGLITTEFADIAVFQIRLSSQPTGTVTIPLSSSDTTEGTVVPTSLTFDASNWNMPQSVTVTGVDDAIVDGDIAYTIVTGAASSSDGTYNGIDAADVSVTNQDNDGAGFTLDPTGGLLVSEFGDTDTFTIVLNSQPSASVTIGLTSSDLSEGTVSPPSVTFTTANWNVPQTVTVTGVDDALLDGNQTFFIVTAPAVSADLNYNTRNPPDVDVVNFDNETPQVYVKARKLLRVSENGQSAFFRMRLTVAPTAPVTCTSTSSDLTEGTVSPPSVTFTPGNFGFQNITVTGVDDNILDGAVLFTILNGACTSTDPRYNGADPRDVSALNRDNE